MYKFLLFIMVLISSAACGQVAKYQLGSLNPRRDVETISDHYMRGAVYLGMYSDTNFHPSRAGAIVYRITDNYPYFWNGSYWQNFKPASLFQLTDSLNTVWRGKGNTGINASNFIGSINNASLRFRTNNIEGMVLDSNQRVQFKKYGLGSFTGTPSYSLQVDASGNIIEGPATADTSSFIHKLYSITETITGGKTFSDTSFLNYNIPTTDSSTKIANTKWTKQVFAQKVAGLFPLYSVPVANASGILAATSDFTYDNSTSTLNIGYAGFYSTSYINHGGNGIIGAGGSGLTLIAQGGYPVDPSKSFNFYNSGYLYGKMSTTGVVGTWQHYFDLYTNFRIRGMSTDSTAPATIGTTKMVVTDQFGQFSFANIPATGTGTLTGVSVATANGFSGSSSGGATPVITITTPLTGLLIGNGTAMSVAVPNTDYLTPSGNGSALTGLTKTQVALNNVDNTSDATKNSATATLTNKTLTSPILNSPRLNTTSPLNGQWRATDLLGNGYWANPPSSDTANTVVGPVLSFDGNTHTLSTRQVALDSLSKISVNGITAYITSGSTYPVDDSVNTIMTDPSSVISSFTYTLPPNPINNEVVEFFFGGTVTPGNVVVTTLSILPGSGTTINQYLTPNTAKSGDNIIYKFNKINNTWYRRLN
jgi:hypothetical protein